MFYLLLISSSLAVISHWQKKNLYNDRNTLVYCTIINITQVIFLSACPSSLSVNRSVASKYWKQFVSTPYPIIILFGIHSVTLQISHSTSQFFCSLLILHIIQYSFFYEAIIENRLEIRKSSQKSWCLLGFFSIFCWRLFRDGFNPNSNITPNPK